MAFKKSCILATATLFFIFSIQAQTTVWYPVSSSQLLKATAEDAAMLLQKASNGSTVNFQSYTQQPTTGFIFKYDSTITDNQACRVQSNGTNKILFSASQDNGLAFGIYQYLRLIGFRFYQPGSIWETTPTLSSPYKNIDTVFSSSFKYKTWYVSGGHNKWIMDNNNNYGWDTYFGENGHNWALYQRRNGMTGAYRFAGHRGDVMTGSYMQTIQNNPCYVASYNNSRVATTQSVPDVNNLEAKLLWKNTIEQKYTQYQNIIYSNTTLYSNTYRNYNFNYGCIGLEVPDGAQWGNSSDNACDNNQGYSTASNQHFTLANFTAQNINATFPNKKFQLYAYSRHADVPTISINSNIDVMVAPTAFQNESSAKGLLNRWYSKHPSVSEYHYLNIPQWGGETPLFYSSELKTTINRLKEKNSQGIAWEASPAKFASLPFLLAANNDLLKNESYETTLQDFCNSMFGNAASTINTLLKTWTSDEAITTGNFIQDNRYKIPYYIQLLNTASQQTQNDNIVVKQRLSELKAYIHYLVLYYKWYSDNHSNELKKEKAGAICMYLAKANKLQIVNSYFIILDITSRYTTTSDFYNQYNVNTGTAYQNGTINLLTSAEIENNFSADVATYANQVTNYKFETAQAVKAKFNQAGMETIKKINVKIGYTNGLDFNNRTEFYIDADKASNFAITYSPSFDDATNGFINFTCEDVNKTLGIVKDFNLTRNSATGKETIQLPAAGTYKLTITSKFKSSVDLSIETNGNYFYKNTAFIGNKTESYRNDLLSLPGYFYIPQGINKVYFSVNNNLVNGKYASIEEISKTFFIKDNLGNNISSALVSNADSLLFYFEVPAAQSGAFWQVYKMEQYNLCFANISNTLWYAQRKACSNSDFTVDFVKKNGSCLTQLKSKNGGNLSWEVYDLGRWLTYENVSTVDLPESVTHYAIVTLKNGANCFVTKRLGAEENYIQNKMSCFSAAPAAITSPVGLFPNPTTGIMNCSQNNISIIADEIELFNAQGNKVAAYLSTRQINISSMPAGMYTYKLTYNNQKINGRVIKL